MFYVFARSTINNVTVPARYRGLAKNGAQYDTLFALGNLVIAKKALLQSMENSVCETA